jgi:hypothetical protein
MSQSGSFDEVHRACSATLQELLTVLHDGGGHLKELQPPLNGDRNRQFLQQLRLQFSLWQDYAKHSRRLATLLQPK